MELTIAADVADAHRLLEKIHGRLDSPGPLLRILAEELDDYETEMFATGGRGTWAADDPATAAAKGGGRVLVDTGGLLVQLSSTRTTGEAVEVVGTDYAGYLKRGARGMPVRDPAPEPTGADAEKWARRLLGYIVDGYAR